MAERVWLLGTAGLISGALVTAILAPQEAGSPLARLQFPLLALLFWGVLTTPEEGKAARLLPYLALSWLLGMAVEATLSVDGSGMGGMHRDTYASFVLAQGDYVLLAVVMWGLHRGLGSGVREALWIVAGIGLTEGLVFTGSVATAMASGDVVGMVLVTCYLVAVYWVYLVLPLRLTGVGQGQRRWNPVVLLTIGFATGLAVRVVWGLAYGPLVTRLFALPA